MNPERFIKSTNGIGEDVFFAIETGKFYIDTPPHDDDKNAWKRECLTVKELIEDYCKKPPFHINTMENFRCSSILADCLNGHNPRLIATSDDERRLFKTVWDMAAKLKANGERVAREPLDVFSRHHMIAGQLPLVTIGREGELILTVFLPLNTNERLSELKDCRMEFPLDHIIDNKATNIALSLSIHRYLLHVGKYFPDVSFDKYTQRLVYIQTDKDCDVKIIDLPFMPEAAMMIAERYATPANIQRVKDALCIEDLPPKKAELPNVQAEQMGLTI